MYSPYVSPYLMQQPLMANSTLERCCSEEERRRIAEHKQSCFPAAELKKWKGLLDSEWFYDKRVATIVTDIYNTGETEPVPQRIAVGPAVKIAFYASVLEWFVFATVPWVTLSVTFCDSHGLSHYKFTFVWSISSVLLILFWVIEFLCLRYSIIPQLQMVGGFRILGRVVNFRTWLLFNTVVSLASHTDIVTNGIFLALAIHMRSCQGSTGSACIWSDTMGQSVFSQIPGFVSPQFHKIVFVFWLLMFLQLFVGWLACFPLNWARRWTDRYSCLKKAFEWAGNMKDWNKDMLTDDWMPNYEPLEFDDALRLVQDRDGKGTRYVTLLDTGHFSSSDHGTTLLFLACITRMTSIISMCTDYSKRKVDYYLTLPKPRKRHAFGLTKRILNTAIYRLLFFGIVQSCLQLNAQTTLLAMTTSVAKRDLGISGKSGIFPTIWAIHWQMLFGIFIGLLMYCKNFWDYLQTDIWVEKTLEKTWGAADETMPKQVEQEWYTVLRHRLICLRWGLAIYVIAGVYTFAKFVAVFECPKCMFNLNGCAPISSCCLEHNATEMCWQHEATV